MEVYILNLDVIIKLLTSLNKEQNKLIESITENNKIDEKRKEIIEILNNKIYNYDMYNLDYHSDSSAVLPLNVDVNDIDCVDKHNISNLSQFKIISSSCEIYNNLLIIKIKLNNISDKIIRDVKINIIGDEFIYLTIYNLKKDIIMKEDVDIKIESDLSKSNQKIPSIINIIISYTINNNNYSEILYCCNVNPKEIDNIDVYNKSLLIWMDNIPKDIESIKNKKIIKIMDKCYRILYNENNKLLMILINKYIKVITCDIFKCVDNSCINECFDVLANELNIFYTEKDIDNESIKSNEYLSYLSTQLCLKCLKKVCDLELNK